MKEKTIVGKLYADWCGHCSALVTPWNDMEKKVGKEVDVVSFEETKDKNKLAEFQKKHKVAVQEGYPTLFRIDGGKISYYNGGRDTTSLINWALNKKTVGGKSRRRINKRNKRTRKTRGHR